MQRIFSYLLSGCLFLASGCDRVFDYHPYDVRITGAVDLNATNTARIETALDGRDSFRFAVISDMQRWYDETEDVVRALNARADLDFVIHCGDFSDFGATREFMWQRDILSKLKIPCV